MAFRRGFKRRFTPRFRRRTPVARVRRTWFPSMRHEWCDPVELPLNGCDSELPEDRENDVRIILIDNSSLQANFSDRARVKRIVGDVFWEAGFGTAIQDPAQAVVGNFSIGTYQFFGGLRKDDTSNGLPFGQTYEPMMNDFDFSEAEWIKTWQRAHLSQNSSSISFADMSNMTFPIWRNDTHTTGAPMNILADGSGIIEIVTTGESDCIPCENGSVQTTLANAAGPALGHFHIDFRRTISLRENEQLMLQLGFLFPYLSSAFAANDPTLRFFGGIKTLVEV